MNKTNIFKQFFLIVLSSFIAINLCSQTQMGADIDGEASIDNSGRLVSISLDGNRIAIGAQGNDGNGSNSGHVRVYEYNGSNWNQLGNDIDGEASDDFSGSSVSLSLDGNRVAIGAEGNDGNGLNSGHVRVYEYDGSNWIQLGNDIDGEASGDKSGFAVSISSNGSKVAIGAIENDENGLNSGHVRVYEYDGSNWIQLGNDIDGEASGDKSGFAVSISSNGSKVAIGAIGNDGNGSDSGHVRVYEYNGSNWVQIGNDIDGEAANDISGIAVSISFNGSRVGIGAYANDGNGSLSGHARVFEYNGSNWMQIGNDIDGETSGDQSGTYVSLSGDGNVIGIGAPKNNDNGANSGHVRIFEYNGSSWTQLGNDIDGETAGDESGSVAISNDGSIVIVGGHKNDGNGMNSGHCRIYGNTLLPVDLVKFIGILDQKNIKLSWDTASESYNLGFELQKSKNGKDWQILDFIQGKGTSSFVNEYEYIDSNPFSGINYYRLKQIDYDGVFEFSKVIAVEYNNSKKEIQVFPNPSNRLINIQIENPSNQRMKVKISDNLGRKIWESELIEGESNWRKEMEIDGNGIYFITAQIGNEIFYERVIMLDEK